MVRLIKCLDSPRAEDRRNSNGKRLLDLVRWGDFVVRNKLQCCE